MTRNGSPRPARPGLLCARAGWKITTPAIAGNRFVQVLLDNAPARIFKQQQRFIPQG